MIQELSHLFSLPSVGVRMYYFLQNSKASAILELPSTVGSITAGCSSFLLPGWILRFSSEETKMKASDRMFMKIGSWMNWWLVVV